MSKEARENWYAQSQIYFNLMVVCVIRSIVLFVLVLNLLDCLLGQMFLFVLVNVMLLKTSVSASTGTIGVRSNSQTQTTRYNKIRVH